MEDMDICTRIRKLMALALLPLDTVQMEFFDLCKSSPENIIQTLH